jgi:uncharacterized protein
MGQAGRRLPVVTHRVWHRGQPAPAGARGARRGGGAAGIEIGDLRVRDLDDRARIEVDATAVESVRVCRPALDAVRAAGFDGVDIEVLAFRSGSMNSLLEPSPARG